MMCVIKFCAGAWVCAANSNEKNSNDFLNNNEFWMKLTRACTQTSAQTLTATCAGGLGSVIEMSSDGRRNSGDGRLDHDPFYCCWRAGPTTARAACVIEAALSLNNRVRRAGWPADKRRGWCDEQLAHGVFVFPPQRASRSGRNSELIKISQRHDGRTQAHRV
jgi:hypothetical protein